MGFKGTSETNGNKGKETVSGMECQIMSERRHRPSVLAINCMPNHDVPSFQLTFYTNSGSIIFRTPLPKNMLSITNTGELSGLLVINASPSAFGFPQDDIGDGLR
jgi:hypothetical protein